MQYVYILRSTKDQSKYIGTTSNIKHRLEEHNRGETTSIKSKAPYILVWYCAFSNTQLAFAFEKYLKSSSGHAFTNKHFL